ncbi:hypothetical protein O6H91_03G021200 [Diphasiastrum complanatum]|uniref:Uncharacterized protein n=1 Tax=Diphasiastrum complanatum TaxID=34168 RepID=A0ACC2E435_DIPCM|nr:hypothetical protein O6H91_03G021200 [Diphasiastrum complanatum]
MVKLGTYAAASALAAIAVVCHAFHSREQFYPAMIYLASSKISLVLLLNMCLVIMCSVWQLVKFIFLGTLREAEIERLNEQSVRELMEVLFAMTVYRQEFSVSFAGMVTVLLFIKAFHWLAQKRVEYIEITPAVSRVSHLRIVTFMILLFTVDSLFLHTTVSHLLKTKRHSVALFFALEYVILATSTLSMIFKYALYMADIAMEGRWDNKAVYIFYLELVRDLLHLSLYLVFFFVIFVNHGMPLHLVRELYETFRNFKARVTDFIRYKKVTSNMNERFPDVTTEELGRDTTCIICREEMLAAKKLPCGHLFHVHCLRSWLERQQTCPTCRSPVLRPQGSPVTRAVNPAANPADRHQQDQPAQEGQGVAISEASGNHQPSGPRNVNLAYSQHQARMQAASMAAAQYGSSFVYPATISGNTNWYPAYVPVIPQQYMISVPRPSMTTEPQRHSTQEFGGSTQGGESAQSQAGLLPQSSGNAQTPPAYTGPEQLSISTTWQYTQYSPYSFYPTSDLSRLSSILKQNQDSGSSSCIQTDVDAVQTASSTLLELQQLQVQHRIELLQKQLQWAINLQSQLGAASPGIGPDSHTLEPRDATVSQQGVQNSEQAFVNVNRKGKAPDVAEDLVNKGSTSFRAGQAN